MKCPHCNHAVRFEEDNEYLGYFNEDETQGFRLRAGTCPECTQLIVLLDRGHYMSGGNAELLLDISSTSIIYPPTRTRDALPPEVPEPYRGTFDEAAAVLDISPKASAAISRRLLQHTLREHLSIMKPTLAAEIDEFISRPGIPSHISEAVDAVRNVGNFAAHPLKDTNTGEVVDVEPGEAEWLLEALETLFDFTFVQPVRLAARKAALNSKLTSLGKPPMKG